MLPQLRPLFVLAVAASGCLADNPGGGETDAPGTTTTDTDPTEASASNNDSASASATPSAGESEGPTSDGSVDNMLGCAPGRSCWVLLAAQTLDDRVEFFGGSAGATPTYRGALDLDLKPGTTLGPLDEPFGMALGPTGLHVVTGHYPTRELGAMISFPPDLFDDRGVETIAKSEFFAGGAFSSGVIEARFEELEPIFVVPSFPQGRLLVSVFANDLFAAEDTWTRSGKLAIVDPSNPSEFAITTLDGLQGGDCLGASQMVLLGDERTAAVACDGNEAVAFLDLGDLTVPVADAAAGVSGTVCELPFPDRRRARYLAPDGAGGVLLGLGPTPQNPSSSFVYNITSECGLSPISIADSDGQLGELQRFGDQHWLLARGALAPDGERGVMVLDGGGVCGTIEGLDDAWPSEGSALAPYALAVAPDSEHLAIGAGPSQLGSVQDSIFGKVLWATLSGTDDPCTMTATVTDLTDGGSGSAPAATQGDPSTWRQGPNVVVLAEVQG